METYLVIVPFTQGNGEPDVVIETVRATDSAHAEDLGERVAAILYPSLRRGAATATLCDDFTDWTLWEEKDIEEAEEKEEEV